MTSGPLAGRRILVTRAKEQSSSLQHLLEAAGADVIAIPAIEIVSPESFDSLDQALRSLAISHEFDWLIFTSANAVRAMQHRARSLGISVDAPPRLSIAAIGNATADAVRAAGLPVHLIPPKAIAESLAEALAPLAQSKRILLIRAAEARDVLPQSLLAAGAQVSIAVAYRTILPVDSLRQLRDLASGPAKPIDAITFTSASSVHHLATLAEAAGIAPAGIRKISIGPITSAALAEHGWHADAEATTASLEALVSACADALLACP